MTLLGFLVIVALIGLLFYLVDKYIPMDPPFRTVLRVVAVFIAILLVLSLFNIVHFPFKLF